jgi:imidazole glycerol phosphate synthase subunit HisF
MAVSTPQAPITSPPAHTVTAVGAGDGLGLGDGETEGEADGLDAEGERLVCAPGLVPLASSPGSGMTKAAATVAMATTSSTSQTAREPEE